jgi:hypothetical protein
MDSLKMSKCLIDMLTAQERHKSHTCALSFLTVSVCVRSSTVGRKFRPLSEVSSFFQQGVLSILIKLGRKFRPGIGVTFRYLEF